jgi:ABC-type glutathione transport system ATPase component
MVNQDVTAIIVSHQLERVASLCKHAVLLRHGEVAHAGPATETVAAYVSGTTEAAAHEATDSPLVIRKAELLTEGRVVSGSRVLVRITAEVIHPARLEETAGVGLRVRSMQNGKVLFATSSLRQGLSLEGLTRFTVDTDLQLNTAAGVYAIETVVFDRRRGQVVGTGPWISVTVHEGKSFLGEVQMNPQMMLRSPSSVDQPHETHEPHESSSVLQRS